MKEFLHIIIAILILLPTLASAQKHKDADGKIKVALVKNQYKGDRRGLPTSKGPDILEQSGLKESLAKIGGSVERISNVQLSPEEESQYGVRNKFGFSSKHLADFVAANEREGYFNVGLLNNCTSLLGMLSGLQHSGPGMRPLRIGMIFVDAHGDYNTPETTLSGMLGGMPVAIAAGHCLTRLRLQSGLEPALPERYIVIAGLRDTDPLEQERLDNSLVEMISVDDIRNLSDNIHKQMERLSRLTDKIYIHIDMDVLYPREVAGHPLTVPDGPTSKELAAALEVMFKYEEASAIGIASYPIDDKDGLSLKAAYNLIEGAIRGVRGR
jgi:arginase